MADPLMIAAERIDKLEAENASLQSLLDDANLKWAQDMDRADAENAKLRVALAATVKANDEYHEVLFSDDEGLTEAKAKAMFAAYDAARALLEDK